MLSNADCLSPDVYGGVGDHEGPLLYKSPKLSRKGFYDSGYKERWFKLVGNLLFYYRLNQHGGVLQNEPNGVLVLENVEVKQNGLIPGKGSFGFSLTWKNDLNKSHLFLADSDMSRDQWIAKLSLASYSCLTANLLHLRLQLRRKTGKDPLEHELGRPQLFPEHSRVSKSEGRESPNAPTGNSCFYANSSWYGSSPCLASPPPNKSSSFLYVSSSNPNFTTKEAITKNGSSKSTFTSHLSAV